MLSENIFSLNFCPPIFVTQIFALPQYLGQVYAADYVETITLILSVHFPLIFNKHCTGFTILNTQTETTCFSSNAISTSHKQLFDSNKALNGN